MLLAPIPSSLRRRELGPGCLGFCSFLSQPQLGPGGQQDPALLGASLVSCWFTYPPGKHVRSAEPSGGQAVSVA